MALLANGNAYTISTAEIPQGIRGLQGAIESNAVAAIEYLSRYVTWKGTLDFVVRWDTKNFDGWWLEDKNGFAAYGGTGSDSRTYANAEAISGIDANGSDYDIGTWISYYSTEKLANYGADVFIDSNMDPLEKHIPEGNHDFYSIFLHEVFHGLGAWSNSQHGGSPTAFDMLSDIENGKWHFTGPATKQYFGGSLPLAETGSRDHFSDKIHSAYKLNREYGNYDERWSLTGLELAVLKDLGYILTEDGDALLSEKYGVNKGNGTPGTITGSGAFREGVTITAPVVSGDPDGMPTDPKYKYQWFQNSTPISGATTRTYKVPNTGSGTYRAAVTYNDAQGFTAIVNSPDQFIAKVLTGTSTANTLAGTIGVDLITGLGGADRKTGGKGKDTFQYRALSDSRLSTYDRITDFTIGTDIFDAPRAVNAANLKQLSRVTALTQAGIEKVLGKSNSTLAKQVFASHQGATFTFRIGGSTRTYLALNDATAGFDQRYDGIVEITGFTGDLNNLAII